MKAFNITSGKLNSLIRCQNKESHASSIKGEAGRQLAKDTACDGQGEEMQGDVMAERS